MHNFPEAESARILTQTIREYTRLSHFMINDVQNTEQISVNGFSKLDKARLSLFHVTRSTNLLSSLLGIDHNFNELHFCSFNAAQLGETLCKTISDTLSTMPEFSLNFISTLTDDSSPLTADMHSLELIIFNIIYYCLADAIPNPKSAIRLELRLFESENDYTFSLKQFGAARINNPFDLLIFENDDIGTLTEERFFSANLATISLMVANNLLHRADSHIVYQRVRGTNLYSFSLNKHISQPIANELILYEPDMSLIFETFSDILLKLI